MQPVLNVEDVKAVENGLSEQGVSISELMRRARGAAAEEVMRLEDVHAVAILVGFGNNGGDGWVASQVLQSHGYSVTVVSPVEPADYADVVAPHTNNVDKYSRGSVLVVAGSSRYPGAAVMAAKAAARAGAGYVTLAVPVTIAPLIQMQLPEVPVVGVAAEQDGTFSAAARPVILKLAERSSATLVGPGMRVTGGTVAVVSALINSKAPLVVDADGLNCLARLTNGHLDEFPEVTRRDAPLVLTPHCRELGRLVGLADTPPDSLTAALEAARRIVWADGGSELCVVAKGTATACVGVEAALLPEPGTASLATAGSGDVLGGIICALLARTPDDIEDLPLIAAFGCEVHAVAGSRAAKRYGSRGVMAGDIADEVGLAVDELEDHVSSLVAGAAEDQEP